MKSEKIKTKSLSLQIALGAVGVAFEEKPRGGRLIAGVADGREFKLY